MASINSIYFDSGDTGFVLISTALVWFMIPGAGYFYSGMAHRKNALSLILLCMVSVAVVTVQWFFFGYSLAFSKSGNKLIGGFRKALFLNLEKEDPYPNTNISESTFAIYQLMFAAITPALAIGSTAERARIFPTIVFIFLWTTLVYDPIAFWVWSEHGWAHDLGSLDFAGGTPVHMASGAAALAYALVLKKRMIESEEGEPKPNNVTNIILGTIMLWFGWFGFNGGSALGANPRATNAIIVTNLSASIGGITWMLWDYRLEGKFSALGFCSGAISGLVAITPASGYVSPPSAIAFGLVSGFLCNLATKLRNIFNYDDACDVFAVHFVGGFIGNILTAIFAQNSIVQLDGHSDPIDGGFLDHNWIQIVYQLANSLAGGLYSFFATLMIVLIMNEIPGLSLRASPDSETLGIDQSELGESAYYFLDELIMANVQTGEYHQMPRGRVQTNGNIRQNDVEDGRLQQPSL
uniref:Ammonium transporter n=1 Tax=Geosiphon pyriformis TaxID=50956 RepID=U3LZ95_9GLOM|nr:ammonium transporter 1 [Geosiphon pyriformis]